MKKRKKNESKDDFAKHFYFQFGGFKTLGSEIF
jgi:hypothetical protein